MNKLVEELYEEKGLVAARGEARRDKTQGTLLEDVRTNWPKEVE